MDLTFTKEQDQFREEVRTWLEENIPTDDPPHGDFDEMVKYDMAWQRRQFDAGWAGISWPKEYGGRGLSSVEQIIWYEEYARAQAPTGRTNFCGVNHAGPTLIKRGTEEHKQRHLRRILAGEEVWCQGFSEPDAGSDLAALRTRGHVNGDRIVVNGQKVWTSFAWAAQFQELLVRTDPDAGSKHKGITWIICPMDLPGITIRPIRTIADDEDFCEVFYDDVEIPIENVVGDIDDGWNVAMTTLSFERGTAFMSEQVALSNAVDRLIQRCRTQRLATGELAIDDEEVRARLAALRTDVIALRAMTYLGFSRNERREQPGPEGSYLRLTVGETMQRIAQLALDVLGDEGMVATPPIRRRSNWSNDYLYSFSRTISAGTKDIQRNLIAERILGLPR